jgi:hypothetical protein
MAHPLLRIIIDLLLLPSAFFSLKNAFLRLLALLEIANLRNCCNAQLP